MSKDPLHILTAEDSPTQAERLKYALESNGYAVTSTANGRQALEMARKNKPALVISDVLMPEMDGYQLCKAIKSDPHMKNVPVILLTTLSDPQDVIRALESGADNFIIKPYDEKYLLSRIEFVLANHQIRERDQSDRGVEVFFNGQAHLIKADRLQILNLLLCTYEAAIQRNQELSNTKDDLRKANVSLESTNKELEAFSYSVSHDLRAPLRTIDGFSAILSAEYSSKLDTNGQDLLKRVRNACARMGQLIEDLLNLSRLSRSELRREPVNLTDLSQSILDVLKKNQPDRDVKVQIDAGLIATGDARLLQIAMENLLGNAWKFTSKRPDAIIEVTMTRDGGEQIYIVRDNGAGFDMAYAKKLFGAFQRLHTVEEFAGTGVGLATVQRIIHRHGGRIWAESAVGQGATFHFTL